MGLKIGQGANTKPNSLDVSKTDVASVMEKSPDLPCLIRMINHGVATAHHGFAAKCAATALGDEHLIPVRER